MRALVLAIGLLVGGGCAAPEAPSDVQARLALLSPAVLPGARPDVSNRYADDPRAAALGKKLFFDPRFSGPLLDEDNQGTVGTLGLRGETGRVSCAGCHVPTAGFLDARSPGQKLSLASSWTRRRTPSLLDFGQAVLLMWDGRRDTAYAQPFGVFDSPLEFNSSRLFVAQQMVTNYRGEYEAIFGPMPALDAYAALDPADAGCAELPAEPVGDRCPKPGQDDDEIVRILVNFGKAVEAYERLLTCGPSRFDAWMRGDEGALDDEEKTGAAVFVRAGCDGCHVGPSLSDQKFHNVGAANLFPAFIAPYDDPGAAVGLAAARSDRLSSRGPFSDGDDGRLDAIPADTEPLRGAFRTPSLRCVSRRPSFMHGAQIRTLEDVVLFFNQGGDTYGFQGQKDALITPLGLDAGERAALVAFLRALDGPGPDASLLTAGSPP